MLRQQPARRRFLLHYFGEVYDDSNCDNMCDNCRNPKEKIEVETEMKQALEAVIDLEENYGIKTLVEFILGKGSKEMKDFKFDQKVLYGAGKEKDETFWSSVYRQALLNDLVYKDIESYGLIKMTEKGRSFIQSSHSIKIPINHNYDKQVELEEPAGKSAVLDNTLMNMLKDLRKKEAKRLEIPPFVIFQDPSLEEMATQYPTSQEEMTQISGVSKGKAERYGKPFISLISEYVKANDIERPSDFIVKQVANKSKNKSEYHSGD